MNGAEIWARIFITFIKDIIMVTFLSISGLTLGIIIAIIVVVVGLALWPSIKKSLGRQIEGRDSYDKDHTKVD